MVVIAALALGGCTSTLGAGTVRPQLPDLPPRATALCARPVARAGDDARAVAARYSAAYGCESGRRVALIVFYRDLRQRLGGQ
jgi:hypothetical protein